MISCDLLSNYYLYTVRNNFVVSYNAYTRGCDLLSNYYLYTVRNNYLKTISIGEFVVTCFQITIFTL